MDSKKIILLIKERDCLWDPNSENYHSRDIQKRTWDEVAELCNQPVEEIKKKWRGLRDVFRREYKKAMSRTSASGGEFVPKWPYYTYMSYLKSTMTLSDVTIKSEIMDIDVRQFDPLCDYPTEDDSGSSSQMRSPSEPIRSPSERVRSPPPQTQRLQPSGRVFKSPPKKKTKLRHTSDFDEKLLEIEEEKLSILKANMGDSEMQFLMSLHPFLKKIPQDRQLAVRANLMEVLMNEGTVSQFSPNASVHSWDNDIDDVKL